MSSTIFKSILKKNKENVYTIGFYNVENLFDTINDPNTLDDDFTSEGKKHWNYKRYKNKIKKLSSVISQIGRECSKFPPAIIGLVEVENDKVIRDLTQHKNLQKHHYNYVHYNSPDERGIDVVLLYNKKVFELLDAKTYPLLLEDKTGKRDYTRDILLVKGKLKGELIHILVNHWPSRRSGLEQTENKRIKAAKLARAIIDEINKNTQNAKIIIMGDFNDNPISESVKHYLVAESFYNPMENLYEKGKGTLTFNSKWNLFDQIIFTKNFLQREENKLYFKHAEVFNKDWLKIYNGKLKGSPFRTYIGKWYKGGFSDHFPVYAYFKKN